MRDKQQLDVWLQRQRTDPGNLPLLLGLMFGIALFFGLMFAMLAISKAIWICMMYGYDAYAGGLHFIDKRTLSNGDELSGGAQLLILLPAFAIAGPLCFLYFGKYRMWVNQTYDRYDRA